MLPLSTWVTSGLLSLGSLASVASAQSAGDYFVHDLPGRPAGDTTKMHAGHIEINPESHANLFFWHVQNKHIANRQRTVIWLNGGPGCSSEDGMLMEVGPYRLKDENTLTYNNGSWHEFANLLFVDNPVGTGYSFADTNKYVHELDEMASQFIVFLERFFALFPEYEHDDIYIAGESYAGQHIPYIAKAILDRNKQPATPTPWNLGGLLIGNGWISPKDQYEAYLSFAYEKGVVTKGSDIATQLETQYRICSKDMATQADAVDIKACEAVLQEMLRLSQDTSASTDAQCVNMYDVRKKDSYPSCGMNWPPDLSYVTPYLRKPEVTAALHVSDQKQTGWQECNGAVGHEFKTRSSKPSYTILPDILKETSILLFSGGEDLICNYKGTESLISNMEFNGGKGFETAPSNWAARRDWTFEGEAAGFWQEARNLTYVHFYNASHMVPFDYARRSRDMLDRFMKVDINSIGGAPSQSSLDGVGFSDTTVGGAKQDAAASDQIDEAKWDAYQRSGEVVLTLVAIAATAWGVYIWRSRRHTKGYTGLPLNGDMSMSSLHTRETGLDGFRNKRSGHDVEAGDFDEGELDDLHVTSPNDMERDHYSIGDDSDNDEATPATKRGQSSGR